MVDVRDFNTGNNKASDLTNRVLGFNRFKIN